MINVVNGIDLTAHGGLIGSTVQRYKRFIGGILEWEDLFQAGWLGMHHAAERFEPERGLKFSTYANWWIRAFIQRAIMNERRTVRVPVHYQTDAFKRGELIPMNALSLDAPLDSNSSGSTTWLELLQSESDSASEADQSALEERVDAAVESLDDKQRRVIRGRFWRERTLAEIGDDMGVSRERIRQREAKALTQLKRALGKERDV